MVRQSALGTHTKVNLVDLLKYTVGLVTSRATAHPLSVGAALMPRLATGVPARTGHTFTLK